MLGQPLELWGRGEFCDSWFHTPLSWGPAPKEKRVQKWTWNFSSWICKKKIWIWKMLIWNRKKRIWICKNKIWIWNKEIQFNWKKSTPRLNYTLKWEIKMCNLFKSIKKIKFEQIFFSCILGFFKVQFSNSRLSGTILFFF